MENAAASSGEIADDDDSDVLDAMDGIQFGQLVMEIVAEARDQVARQQKPTKANRSANVSGADKRARPQQLTKSAEVDALLQLTVPQVQAIEALLQGMSHAKAAAAAGVNRSTVTTWRNQLPGYIAEFNRRREEIYGGIFDRVRSRAGRAVDAVDEALESENQMMRLRAGAILLRMYGKGQFAPPKEPTDVPALLDKLVRQRLEEKNPGPKPGSEAWIAECDAVLADMRNALRAGAKEPQVDAEAKHAGTGTSVPVEREGK